MGDAINMAARLMCLPQAREGILCDERSFKMCQKEFMFESLGETKVKGKSAPISIFQPRGMHPRSENSKTTMQKAQKLIGRQNEKDIIQEVLQNLNNLEAGSTYFEADGGQGLNSLAEFVVSECEQISAPFA